MTILTTLPELCPHCEVEARLVREQREVPLGQRRVVIDDERYHCDVCDEEFYAADQADQRHRRAIDQARIADTLLTPAQIRSIREGQNLSQERFEKLLGVGPKTCVRWETGRVCQNVATDRLIRLLAANAENVRLLAAMNGVVLSGAGDSAQPPAVPSADPSVVTQSVDAAVLQMPEDGSSQPTQTDALDSDVISLASYRHGDRRFPADRRRVTPTASEVAVR